MKIILPSSFLLLSHLAFSQLTITNNQFLAPGDSIFQTCLDPANFDTGAAGPNVIWDYTNVSVELFNCQEDIYTLPQDTSIHNILVTNRNFFGFLTGDSIYVDSTRMSLAGISYTDTQQSTGTTTYYNKKLLLPNPFNYQDSFTDTFAGITTGQSSSGQTFLYNIYGAVYKYYNAYGELRLPWGIYPNVARLLVITYDTDSDGIPYQYTKGYEWYDESSHDFVLTYIRHSWNSLFTLKGQRRFPTNISTPSPENSLHIYPNPTRGKFTVDVPDRLSNSELIIRIYDMLGRETLESNLLNRNGQVDITSFSPGIYCVVLSDGKYSFRNRIVLE